MLVGPMCAAKRESEPNSELRRNLNMWENKNPFHSISCYLLRLYWLMCLECGWIDCKSIYVYASL